MFLNFLLAFIIHFHDSIIMNLPKMNFKKIITNFLNKDFLI